MIGATASAWEGLVGLEGEVAQLRRGNLDALSQLIARYQNRLYRYLLRLVHDPAAVEDLFQQTWLRVAERIESFDPRRNFDAWLFTVTRHLAIDHLRRNRPQSLDEPVGGEPGGETGVDRLVSREILPLDGLLEIERSGRLAAALQELPVIYREVISLRFEEEMKIEEIAQVLGAPLSTVKSRLRRSLEQLRATLESRSDAGGWS